MAGITPSQTIGPFFHEATRWLVTDRPCPAGWVTVAGRVLDVDGKPVSDAMLEVAFSGATPEGFQRVFSGDEGAFQFHMPLDQVAHLTVFARGLLRHLFTRVHLDAAHVPAAVPAARRGTLVAVREGTAYRWNLHLSGDHETVFFDQG